MKRLQIAFAALFLVVIFSCNDMGRRVKGNGNRVTETREVKSASRIKVSGAYNVVLSKGDASLKIEGDENLLELITTETNDGVLEISTRRNVNIQSDQPLVIHVSTPELTEVGMAGSGEVTGEEKFVTTNRMVFKMAGSGSITLAVNTPKIDAAIGGSGNISLSGETRDLKVSIGGSGNFNAFDLKAENTKVSIAGSGNAYVYSDVDMNASIAGSGVVEYKGNAEVSKKIMGSGTVIKR